VSQPANPALPALFLRINSRRMDHFGQRDRNGGGVLTPRRAVGRGLSAAESDSCEAWRLEALHQKQKKKNKKTDCVKNNQLDQQLGRLSRELNGARMGDRFSARCRDRSGCD
ncbi:MAG: hypothetical protein AAFO06_24860, partial [Cyanobacteria bacterium J06597_16]